MNPTHEHLLNLTRRQFFGTGVSSMVGWAALTALLDGDRSQAASPAKAAPPVPLHHLAKAKQVIYLHMVGGPGQMDLYDYKPKMKAWYDKDLPDSVRMGQRLTTMTSG